MRVRDRWIAHLPIIRQPFSLVCTDEIRLDVTIVFITELQGVEVQMVLEVFSAGEAAVKHLIRFIWALGGRTFWISIPHSVLGVHTPHILPPAS